MKRQFVDLFDPDGYGWNYSAALWLLAGLLASYFISLFQAVYSLATFAGADSLESFFDFLALWARGKETAGIAWPIGDFLFSWVWGLINAPILAASLIGLAHIFKKDYLLPFGVSGVTLSWVFVMQLLAVGGFELRSALMPTAWSFLLSGSLVVCYRVVGNKLASIVLAFAVASILQDVTASLLFGVPLVLALFSFNTVMGVAQSSLAGFIFGRGMATTIRRYGDSRTT